MYKNLPKQFVFLDQYDGKIFENKIENLGVIYRNYASSNREIELIKIAKACKNKRYKLFVSNDVKLAIKIKADGIYIPSFNRTKRFTNLEKKKLILLGSAHNQREIQQKILQKGIVIFLSPLFHVKKAKQYLGIHKFNALRSLNKINICALGGINNYNIRKLKLLSIIGFGGKSIFKKKPAYKRPVF